MIMQISGCNNIYSNNSFSGYFGAEAVSKKVQNSKFLIHETAFFRDMKPLEFAKKYIKTNLPANSKLNIIDGACSNGEETYTLAMLFCEMKDKLHITGFDLSEKCLEKAKKGIFSIFSSKDRALYDSTDFSHFDCLKDEFLVSEKKLSHNEMLYKDKFEKNFEKITKKDAKIPFSERLQMAFSAPMPLKTDYYKVKPDLAKNCDFKTADINNLSDIAEDKSADIFLFRNAMYHLTDNFSSFDDSRTLKPENELREVVGNILNSVKSKLKDGGLFIIGSKEAKETGDKTGIIQKIIKENGFEPVYSKDGFTTVWKKVSD